jgi:hypothetical protein
MKKLILLASLCLAAAASAPAGIYHYDYNTGFVDGGNIPNGNASPWSDTRTVGGITELSIESVSFRLNLSGGFNGDLYAYLSYNGTKLVLLNRVGVGTLSNPVFTFGYSGAGFTDLVLKDGGANGDIHIYGGGVGTGSYSADGRDVSPLTSAATLYGTSRDTFAGKFGTMNPNGDWSLVFADLSGGGGQATVLNWGLDITAVPEPVSVALALFGGALGVTQLVRFLRRRNARYGA